MQSLEGPKKGSGDTSKLPIMTARLQITKEVACAVPERAGESTWRCQKRWHEAPNGHKMAPTRRQDCRHMALLKTCPGKAARRPGKAPTRAKSHPPNPHENPAKKRELSPDPCTRFARVNKASSFSLLEASFRD